MTIDEKIIHGKLQYDINRVATKISTLSSGKIDKYEYLTVEETFPPQQHRIIEETTFTYSPLAEELKKQTKQLKSMVKTS